MSEPPSRIGVKLRFHQPQFYMICPLVEQQGCVSWCRPMWRSPIQSCASSSGAMLCWEMIGGRHCPLGRENRRGCKTCHSQAPTHHPQAPRTPVGTWSGLRPRLTVFPVTIPRKFGSAVSTIRFPDAVEPVTVEVVLQCKSFPAIGICCANGSPNVQTCLFHCQAGPVSSGDMHTLGVSNYWSQMFLT